MPGVTWTADFSAATEGADLMVLLTEWNDLRALDLGRIAKAMNTPKMADLRNINFEGDVCNAGSAARGRLADRKT